MGEFVFRGIDGAELEAFMLHLRRLALSEGKHRDEDWMLDVVTANLAEGAMRWFETLEDEQQKNWKAFRKALFKEYPAPAGRDAPKPVAKCAAKIIMLGAIGSDTCVKQDDNALSHSSCRFFLCLCSLCAATAHTASQAQVSFRFRKFRLRQSPTERRASYRHQSPVRSRRRSVQSHFDQLGEDLSTFRK